MFGKISEIDINDPQSFQKIFLTFDIDWASDEVLEYCLEIVEKAKVKATWFATHKTPLLKRILENPLFELGIHPNFNPLLEGNFCYGKNYKEVLEYYLEIVPNAKVMRSHSLAHSSRILIEAKNLGITHESNICIPCVAFEDGGGGALLPYLNWDGLVRCPYHWADDIAFLFKNIVFKNIVEIIFKRTFAFFRSCNSRYLRYGYGFVKKNRLSFHGFISDK